MNTTTTKIAGEAMTKDQIRDIFMAHGFTIKEGQTDLKPYVYDAARALLASKAAVAGHFGSFEKWAENYGFHAELVDVHQYAKEAARDAWTSGYMAGYLEGGLDEADKSPTAPAQSCGDAEQADAPQAVEQWQFRVKDVGSPLWTNITHADANELSSNPAFELRALSLVSPLPRADEQAGEAVTLPTIPAIPMTQDELNELPDWIKNARPPEAV